MTDIIRIPVEDIVPPVADILAEQGIPDISKVNQRILNIAEKSIADFREFSRPLGIVKQISKADFELLYSGEGGNEPETPLDMIYKDAFELALFAVTLGADITARISSYFKTSSFPDGSMLDSAASAGAESAADYIETSYREKLIKSGAYPEKARIMRFSPGYCGWNVTGQKKLFQSLKPGKIGIALNSSSLMEPLKSISGIIVCGPGRIFEFEDDFPFCSACSDHSCAARINLISDS